MRLDVYGPKTSRPSYLFTHMSPMSPKHGFLLVEESSVHRAWFELVGPRNGGLRIFGAQGQEGYF